MGVKKPVLKVGGGSESRPSGFGGRGAADDDAGERKSGHECRRIANVTVVRWL